MIPLITSSVPDSFYENAEGIVQATDFEILCLREEHDKDLWSQSFVGYLEEVGRVGKYPVCIAVHCDIVNGKRILFWHATSQVVDYKKIDKFFHKKLPDVTKTNAMNFHLVT